MRLSIVTALVCLMLLLAPLACSKPAPGTADKTDSAPAKESSKGENNTKPVDPAPPKPPESSRELTGLALPGTFPDDAPTCPGTKVTSVFQGRFDVGVRMRTDDDPTKLLANIAEQLREQEWQNVVTLGGGTRVRGIKNERTLDERRYQAIKSEEDGKTFIDLTVQLTREAGKIPLELQSEFPADFPVYPQALLHEKQTGETYVEASFQTAATADRLEEYYLQKLNERGWFAVPDLDYPYTYRASKESEKCVVHIAEDDRDKDSRFIVIRKER